MFSEKFKSTTRVMTSYQIVMCRTPFYRTLNGLEHQFSNIERTRTCSSIESQTSNGHRTNIEHFSVIEKETFCTFFCLIQTEKREKSFLSKENPNKYHKLLFSESFLANRLKLDSKLSKKTCNSAWTSIFHVNLMFTKCSSNSASNIERTLNMFIS